MQHSDVPDLVVLGHVCRDLQAGSEGWQPGGSVLYAASAAARLGFSVGAVTVGGTEVEALRQIPGVAVASLDVSHSTTFELRHEDGARRMALRRLAPPIPPELIPPSWTRAAVALMAPVAGEAPAALYRLFPRSLVGVSAQGYLRDWSSPGGEVRYRAWARWAEILDHCAAVIYSEEDLQGHTPDWIRAEGPIFVMTLAERGCELLFRGKRRLVPGFPTAAVASTGAGDVFAAAFMLKLGETRNAMQAARFANCTAGLFVSGERIQGLPTKQQVEDRLAQLPPEQTLAP